MKNPVHNVEAGDRKGRLFRLNRDVRRGWPQGAVGMCVVADLAVLDFEVHADDGTARVLSCRWADVEPVALSDSGTVQ